MQVAIPTLDKPRDEVTPMDYQVTTIDIGPFTSNKSFKNGMILLGLSRHN